MNFLIASKNYLEYLKANAKKDSYITIKARIDKYFKYLKTKNLPLSLSDEIKLKNHINNLKISQNYKATLWITYAQIINFNRRYYNLNAVVKLKPIKKQKYIFNIWTEKQFKDFISTLKNPVEILFFNLLFYTGARRGEILALTKKNILTSDKIAINATFSRNHITTTKTAESTRILTIPHSLTSDLIRLANLTKDNERLFKNLTYTTLKRRLDTYCDKNSLNRIRIHDLRHSNITLLLYNGFTPQGIARRVGHKNIEMLFNTYAGYYDSEDAKIAQKLEQIKNSFY